jgi:alkylhydroperoxidase family enzyme
MTMGRLNGCQFCINLHTRMLRAQLAPAELIQALTAGLPLNDARLEAFRRFIVEVVETHGDVTPGTWTAFREAGYSHEQALDVVAGIGVYTLTTLANRLTETSER